MHKKSSENNYLPETFEKTVYVSVFDNKIICDCLIFFMKKRGKTFFIQKNVFCVKKAFLIVKLLGKTTVRMLLCFFFCFSFENWKHPESSSWNNLKSLVEFWNHIATLFLKSLRQKCWKHLMFLHFCFIFLNALLYLGKKKPLSIESNPKQSIQLNTGESKGGSKLTASKIELLRAHRVFGRAPSFWDNFWSHLKLLHLTDFPDCSLFALKRHSWKWPWTPSPPPAERGNTTSNYQKNSLNPTASVSRKKRKKKNNPDMREFRLFFVHVDEIA